MAYSRKGAGNVLLIATAIPKLPQNPKPKTLETKISLVRGDHVQQLNICFQYFNLVLIFPRNRRRRCAATEYFDVLNILEYIDLILIFSRNRRGRCAATVRSWWRGIPRDHGAGRLFFAHIFLYSFILDILEIMARVGCFVLIYSFWRSWHFWAFCSFIHS